MDSQQHNDTNENDKDELYFKIWEREHSYMQARWTITTFFMSVSFAILGFSLQAKPTSTSALIAQSIVALAVYWFAYLLNKRLYYYTTFLRTQLKNLEPQTTLKLQSDTEEAAKQWRVPDTPTLLLRFGLVYTIGAIPIIWFITTQP